MHIFNSYVLRFLFLVFLADLGKLGGMVRVAMSNVCFVKPPPDTLHPSALNLSLILLRKYNTQFTTFVYTTHTGHQGAKNRQTSTLPTQTVVLKSQVMGMQWHLNYENRNSLQHNHKNNASYTNHCETPVAFLNIKVTCIWKCQAFTIHLTSEQ